MDRVDDISLFLRVLDLGSISAAARHRGVSVAVASQRIKRLERELGVRLLHRTTRTLHATPEGLVLAEQGRALVEELEALTVGLRHAGGTVAGTLRVTMSPTFGRLFVAPLLPELLARHPALRVSVDLSDHAIDLIGAGLDLAIRIGELDDSTLVSRRLATNRRVLCASPDYLRRHGAPRSPAELTQHECLVQVGRRGRSDTWRMTDRRGREVSVRVTGRIEANQGELLREAAIGGLGIAMASTWHVGDDLRAGRLEVVLPDFALAETGIHAVMPERRLVPPRVRAFIDFLAERLGGTPPWER